MSRLVGLIERLLPAGPGRTHVLVAAGLALSLLQFVPANLAHFTFDDYQLIVENPTIRSFDSVGAVLASGRPMRGLTFMVDYALFGLDARGYHLVNLAWHYLANLLLYFLLFRLFGTRIAAFAALLFAFHAIHVEAVMGIAHRKEMLAATFLLLSFHAFLFKDRWPRAAMVMALVFFILGLLSKQVVAALPLLLLGWEWLKRGPEAQVELWRLWPWLLLPVGLLIGGALISLPILADFKITGYFSLRELTLADWSRVLATTLTQVPRYLSGLLFPVHLTVLPPTATYTFANHESWLGLLLLLSLPVAAWLARRDRAVSFGLSWIFINLLPVMNWAPTNSVYADRYLYIPSAGFCLVAAGVWQRLTESRVELVGPRVARITGFLLLFGILYAGAVGSLVPRATGIWTFPELWRIYPAIGEALAGLVIAPFIVLAMEHLESGRYARALQRHPVVEYTLLFILFGILVFGIIIGAEVLISHRFGFPVLLTEAKFERTGQWLSSHARPGPRAGGSVILPSGTTWSELGNIILYTVGSAAVILFVYFRQERKTAARGRTQRLLVRVVFVIFSAMYASNTIRAVDWASEIRLWRTAVMEDPGSAYAHNNLGKAYLDRRRFDLAVNSLIIATRLGPELPETWRNLGLAYLGAGNLPKAASNLEMAVKLQPTDWASRMNLANVMVVEAASGKRPRGYQEAITHYLRILEVYPGAAHVLHNLAFCYYSVGAYNQALDYIERVIQLDPVSTKARQLRADIERARSRAEVAKP